MKKNLTVCGIAYDLRVSPYKTKINYTQNYYITFIFSSELYKRKFEDRIESNRISINESLTKRFGFEIENNPLCDIKLYTSIEKRGFLLRNSKEGFEWLENIKLDGKNLTVKN